MTTLINPYPREAIIFLIHGKCVVVPLSLPIDFELCCCSDILSFYKEEKRGETNNFMHDRARVTGKDVRVVLLELLEEVVASCHKAREILQGEQEREAWERFLSGYISFHLMTPRYELLTLLNSDASE